jgi:Asp-tRNA(Asn)/Glu-tRNA(Gln) amidotransferase A subunit family amidase
VPPASLTTASALELAALVRERQLSPVEVTSHFLDRIAAYDGELGSFITVAAEQAMTAAHAAERALLAGEELGPLGGVPIGVKDLTATRGIRTTYGSLLMADFVPDADDVPAERVRRAGAIIVGKTSTPEYGWKGTTENLLSGPCRNPWDTARVAGGSSGGSAAALAARLVPLATGSDAGGSIRIPASCCGVFGIKPTFGRVPADYRRQTGGWGALSQNGAMAHTVADAALLLGALAGYDERDARSLREPPADYLAAAAQPSVAGLRVGWAPDMDGVPLDPAVRTATARTVALMEDLGAEVDEAAPAVVSADAVSTWATLSLTDLAVHLGPVIAAGKGGLLPPRLVRWLEDAMAWPATRYAMALRALEWHRARFTTYFATHDVLAMPTLAVPPFPIDEPPTRIDGREVHPSWGFTPFCVHANLTGRPAVSIPCEPGPDGLPIGIQLVGRHGGEETLLRAAAALEEVMPWAGRMPPRFV